MIINTYLLLILYSIYAVISTYLFSISTSGFGWLFTFLVFPPIYVIAWIITLVGLITKKTKNTFSTFVSLKLVFIILFAQIFLLFLNTGDCGDSPCSTGYDTNSIRHFFFPKIAFHQYQVGNFQSIFFIIYIITLFIFITKAFPLSEKSKK